MLLFMMISIPSALTFLCVVVYFAYQADQKDRAKDLANWREVTICIECDNLERFSSLYSPCPKCGEKNKERRTVRWINGKREIK